MRSAQHRLTVILAALSSRLHRSPGPRGGVRSWPAGRRRRWRGCCWRPAARVEQALARQAQASVPLPWQSPGRLDKRARFGTLSAPRRYPGRLDGRPAPHTPTKTPSGEYRPWQPSPGVRVFSHRWFLSVSGAITGWRAFWLLGKPYPFALRVVITLSAARPGSGDEQPIVVVFL
jgi:hypothetical protein